MATSFWEEIFFAVQQEYILGPFLCNIYLCDLFYMMSDKDFASYTDNKISYVSTNTIDEILKRLETVSVNLFKWSAGNQIKAN